MDIVILLLFIFIIFLIFGNSKDKETCPSCGKRCKQIFIETLRGSNRDSSYYKCKCCGDTWSNDKFHNN